MTVLFGDTIAAVITACASLGVSVSSKVPNPRPDRFLTVRRSGGTRRNIVSDGAQITIDTWGTSEADAHDLAQLARRAVHAMAGTVASGMAVYHVTELSGPGDMPDESGQARYRQTLIVTTRGVEP